MVDCFAYFTCKLHAITHGYGKCVYMIYIKKILFYSCNLCWQTTRLCFPLKHFTFFIVLSPAVFQQVGKAGHTLVKFCFVIFHFKNVKFSNCWWGQIDV